MARRTSLTSGLDALEIVSGLGILQCVWDKNSADETHRMECGGGGVLSGDARDVLDFDQNRAAGGARRGAAGGRDPCFGRGGVSRAAVAGAEGGAGSCAGPVPQGAGAAHHDHGRRGRRSGVHGGRCGARLSDQPGGASGGDCGGEGGQQYGGLHGSGRRDYAAHGIAVGHRGERRVPYLPREEDARRQGTDCVWVATAGACASHFAGAVELWEAGRGVSDGYHIYRVKKMLEGRGLTVYGSPRPERVRDTLRERWNYVKQAVGYLLWSCGVPV